MESEKSWYKAKEIVEKIIKDVKTKNFQWKKIAAASSMIFALSLGSFLHYQSGFSHEVSFNGTKVGYVQKLETLDIALDTVGEGMVKTHGKEAHFQQEVQVNKVRGHNKDRLNVEKLVENITYNVKVFKPATVVMIDGEEGLVVESKEIAEGLLEDIKKPYIKDVQDSKVKVLDLYIKQDIQIEAKDVAVEDILTKEEAALALGLVEEDTEEQLLAREVVLGKVSRTMMSRMNRAEAVKANADQESSEEKNIESLLALDVVRVENHTTTETIDFKEEEKKDKTLFVGEKKVQQKGEKGKKEVTTEFTYTNGKESGKKVVKEVVLQEAKNKITLIGTKARPKVTTSRGSSGPAPTYNGRLGSAIVATARHYIGVPYRSGGSTPSGFDCSGLTSYVYKQYGIYLPRSAAGQGSYGAYLTKGQLQPGDIVYFTGHVGIYIGGGNMIHSPKPGDRVKIASINNSYFKNRFICGRRPY